MQLLPVAWYWWSSNPDLSGPSGTFISSFKYVLPGDTCLGSLLTASNYTFGQYVRRRAEGFIGKVTCLPGCITMIAVREEMAGAIRKYAEPVTIYPVIHHQVQYLVSGPLEIRTNRTADTTSRVLTEGSRTQCFLRA